MRRNGRKQDGQNKGNEAPRPTALVVIRCKISVCGLSSERKCLFSSAYLPFLASPSEPVPSRDPAQKCTGRAAQIPSTTLPTSSIGPRLERSPMDFGVSVVQPLQTRLRGQASPADELEFICIIFPKSWIPWANLGPVHNLGLAEHQALTFAHCCLPIAGRIELRVLSFMCAGIALEGFNLQRPWLGSRDSQQMIIANM